MKLILFLTFQLSFCFINCATKKSNEIDPKYVELSKLILKYREWASEPDIKQAQETLEHYYKELLKEVALLRVQLEMENSTTKPRFHDKHEEYLLRH